MRLHPSQERPSDLFCMAHLLDWSVQETDHALWELDRRADFL